MCYSLRSVGEEHVLSWRFADSMCWSAGQTSPAELELFDLLVCWAADWVWIFRMINDLIYRAFIEYSYVSLVGENQSCCFMSKLAICPCHRFLGLPYLNLVSNHCEPWHSQNSQTNSDCKFCGQQLHEVVWNITKNELSHTFFRSNLIESKQSATLLYCYMQCYTFWSAREKGIF